MGEVERLLTATMVEIARVESTDPRARYCLNAYFAELDQRFENGFDPGRASRPTGRAAPAPGLLLVATLARRAGRLRRAEVPTTASPPSSSACGSRP